MDEIRYGSGQFGRGFSQFRSQLLVVLHCTVGGQSIMKNKMLCPEAIFQRRSISQFASAGVLFTVRFVLAGGGRSEANAHA